MRVAVTRPELDQGPLAARIEALGHQAVPAPLLSIVPRGAGIPQRDWQAVVATSANGIRMLPAGHGLQSFRMLTVGPQSLAAARAAGFAKAEAHGGDAVGLGRFIVKALEPGSGPILYLSGAETASDLAAQLMVAGFDCQRLVNYDAVPAADLGLAGQDLRDGLIDAVMLYSPRSARIWRALVEKAGLSAAAARPIYLCLSPNVAAVLPEIWVKRIAAAPEEAHMLALLEQTP